MITPGVILSQNNIINQPFQLKCHLINWGDYEGMNDLRLVQIV